MNQTLTIVGAGRVGKTLGYLFHRQLLMTIVDVVNSSPASARAAVEFIGCGRPCDSIATIAPAALFLLAVPDDKIAACCEQLVRSGHVTEETVVFHCSGALGSEVLNSAAALGARVASIHPARSFADPAQVAASFAGTLCGTEGMPDALTILTPLFHAIGARLIPVQTEAKTLYHAAAVFASNYIVSLLAVAQQTYAAAGIAPADALKFATSLAHEAVDNVARLGPAAALTGPIARGDSVTVARHQEALAAWNSDAGALYGALADATRRLAVLRGHRA